MEDENDLRLLAGMSLKHVGESKLDCLLRALLGRIERMEKAGESTALDTRVRIRAAWMLLESEPPPLESPAQPLEDHAWHERTERVARLAEALPSENHSTPSRPATAPLCAQDIIFLRRHELLTLRTLRNWLRDESQPSDTAQVCELLRLPALRPDSELDVEMVQRCVARALALLDDMHALGDQATPLAEAELCAALVGERVHELAGATSMAADDDDDDDGAGGTTASSAPPGAARPLVVYEAPRALACVATTTTTGAGAGARDGLRVLELALVSALVARSPLALIHFVGGLLERNTSAFVIACEIAGECWCRQRLDELTREFALARQDGGSSTRHELDVRGGTRYCALWRVAGADAHQDARVRARLPQLRRLIDTNAPQRAVARAAALASISSCDRRASAPRSVDAVFAYARLQRLTGGSSSSSSS